ncbi:hypothetical protein [Algibacter sp. PT7-4]|uniref:hypothetical protein n=1 Tax=Algibacter ulvanivorans TaxID=3400999 RepID=UPI003AAB1056
MKTLSVIPFVLAILILLPAEAFLINLINVSNQYTMALIFHLICTIILLLIFTGTLIIEFKSKEDLLITKWKIRPLFTKRENQIIAISEIKNWKLLTGRGSDSLKIFLTNNKIVKIDFNNLIDFGKNSKKKDRLIKYLISRNINSI